MALFAPICACFHHIIVAIAIILPVFATLPWKRGQLGRAMRPLRGVAVLALALGALAWQLQTGRSMLAPVHEWRPEPALGRGAAAGWGRVGSVR